MVDYYLKYKEYKKKYLQLEKSIENKLKNIQPIDFGINNNSEMGTNTIDTESSMGSLLDNIKSKLDKKGYVFWLTEEGKIITKNFDEDKAQKSLHRIIKNNKDEYNEKIVIKVKYVITDSSSQSLLDGSAGPVQMGIYIHKVTFEGKNISLAPTKDFNAMRFYYFEKDLKKFKFGDMKKFITGLLTKKDNINSLKFYTFKEAKKLLW